MPKYFVGENLCAVFQKVSVSEKLYALEKGGIKIFRRVFLSHYAENFRRGTLLCCVSDNFRWRKRLWIRGGYQDFPSQNFCLTVPKSFVGEHFYAAFEKISCSEKLYG